MDGILEGSDTWKKSRDAPSQTTSEKGRFKQLEELNCKYRRLKSELDIAYAEPVWDSRRINRITNDMAPVEYAIASLKYGGHDGTAEDLLG